MRCISRAKSAALVCVASISLFTGGCIGGKGATPVTAYELKNYNQDLYQGKLYAEELCVACLLYTSGTYCRQRVSIWYGDLCPFIHVKK